MQVKTKQPKQSTKPTPLSDKALAPLRKWAMETPGSTALIMKAYQDVGGKGVHRQQIERWLHPVPAKRGNPSFESALLLMAAATLLAIKGH
jgi:hypothetical protein